MALRDQFIRRWKLLRALEGGRDWSAEELLGELAREAGSKRGRIWSPRTLQRDLSHLVQSGFPLEGVRRGRKMRYRLREAYLASVPKPFRPSEWAALYYALSTLREAPGSPLREEALGASVSGVFARLRHFVPQGLRAYAEGIEPHYAGVVGGLREQERLRRIGESLSSAIRERRPIRLLAARPGEVRRRWWRVDPYLLGYEGGGYHLLGREAEHDGLEVWHLQGIESVRVGQGAFQLPLGLDLEAALSERLRQARGAGCRLRVRFRKGVALQAVVSFMEEAFGPAQAVRSGGARTVEVTVREADIGAFRRWLMAFGSEAEAVSPKEFRLALAQDLEGALKRYRKD